MSPPFSVYFPAQKFISSCCNLGSCVAILATPVFLDPMATSFIAQFLIIYSKSTNNLTNGICGDF